MYVPVNSILALILTVNKAYLQFRYPIKHAETGRPIPGPAYVWPDGQGDAGKYIFGRDNSAQWQAQYGNVYRLWAGMTPEV